MASTVDTNGNESHLKVLVVDDMLTYRAILSRVLSEFENVEISGTAGNGKQALEKMAQTPANLVLMDLEMPIMNGLETVPELRRNYPDAQVVLISGTNRSSADLTVQALQAGAMDFIAKPAQESLTANMEALRQKLSSVLLTCRESRKKKLPLVSKIKLPEKVENSTAVKPAAVIPKLPPKNRAHGFDVLAIGVSTGGPNALADLLPKLPGNLGMPVVLVQHMPPLFTASLATMLDQKSALRVKEAEDGEALQPNTVYIAPGGRHLLIQRKGATGQPTAVLTDTDPVNSCRPAVDVLFNSLPAIYGERVLSVILTGMGNDGMVGVRTIKQKGGYNITQTEQSCVVYGMPRAVDEQGLSDEQLDLNGIANRIRQLM
jgi:two-component system, chemotaxis family, protein-glutamate methylesterase/glutaminase